MHRHSQWAVLSILVMSLLFAPLIYLSLGKQNDQIVYLVEAFFLAFVALGAGAFFTWIFATEHERHPKNKSLSKALQNFFAHKPTRGALWQIVDGKLTETRAAEGEVAGPAEIIVPKDHAIVFEDKTGKFTHAEFGPGNIPAHSSDNLAKSIILVTRPRFKRLSVPNVTTKDGIVLERIDFTIFYHLKTDPTQYRTGNLQYPITQDTLTQAVYAVTFGEDEQHRSITTWEEAVQESARFFLRSELSLVAIVDIYARNGEAAPVRRIADQARERLNALTDSWGILVENFEVTHVAMPAHIQNKLEEEWIAQRSQSIKEWEGIAEGKKIFQIERAKGDAWKDMMKRMKQSFGKEPGSELVATRYIQIMQYLDSLVQMSRSSSIRMTAPLPQEIDSLLTEFEARLQQFVARRDTSRGTAPSQASVVQDHGTFKVAGSETPDSPEASAEDGSSPKQNAAGS